MKYLMNISGEIPHANLNNINIPLNGRNLIITGKNGSGKTSFLNAFNSKIKLHLSKEIQELNQLESNIEYFSKIVEENPKGSRENTSAQQALDQQYTRLNQIFDGLTLTFDNQLEYLSSYDEFKAIYVFFDAMRKAEIKEAKTTSSLIDEKNDAQLTIKNNTTFNLDNKFEQHLVNIKVNQSLAITEDHDQEQADRFQNWFNSFDNQLKFLFEDNSARLVFYRQNYKFKISLNNREFDFQKLSSGYLAIFKILADLLVRSEFFELAPNELKGIVLIDEIDAHLHISLQKKILPFFTNLFPFLQFIVSTHSPFVITSTDKNTVVYDISSGEFFEDDLSRYSYESVIKGLFHVEIKSEQLESEIKLIAEVLNNEPNSYVKLREILKNISPYTKQLDVESKSFYYKALNHLLDNQELGDLDV